MGDDDRCTGRSADLAGCRRDGSTKRLRLLVRAGAERAERKSILGSPLHLPGKARRQDQGPLVQPRRGMSVLQASFRWEVRLASGAGRHGSTLIRAVIDVAGGD